MSRINYERVSLHSYLPLLQQIRDKKVCNADCTALRLWNVKRASFMLGVGAFRSKFYENLVIPADMLIPFDR